MQTSEPCRFFVPGPVWVRPEVLAEMARPVIGHRSPEFRELFTGILRDLKELFLTNQHAFVATCSGTGLMEASLVNCVPRSVLVTTCGAFSERWLNLAQTLGVEVDHFARKWGTTIDPGELASFISSRHHRYDAITITHNETSTGVMNDLQALARVIRIESPDTLILVDSVSSLAGAPVKFDEWDLDVCFASSQKALGVPPGLAVFAVSERAMKRAQETPYRGLYFDFLQYRSQAATGGSAYTPAVSLCYALAAQLEHILRVEGLEQRWQRHQQMRELVRSRLSGLAVPVAEGAAASWTVTALEPLDATAKTIVSELKARGFTLSSGYGEWRDSTFRIGHMGDMPMADLESMLDVLEEVARR